MYVRNRQCALVLICVSISTMNFRKKTNTRAELEKVVEPPQFFHFLSFFNNYSKPHTHISVADTQNETYVLILNKHSLEFQAAPFKRPPTCAMGELALNIFRIVTGRRLLAENVQRNGTFFIQVNIASDTFHLSRDKHVRVYII